MSDGFGATHGFGAATGSGFVAGFASRHSTGEALARAFSPPRGFYAVGVAERAQEPAETGAARPRHFAPQRPEANPTQGWDMFDPAIEQPTAQPFVDPVVAAHATGYAEGLRSVSDDAAAQTARDRQLLDTLGDALAQSHHFDRERFARQLRQTVLHLVGQLVGEVGVSGDRLAARIASAADLLADSAESALVRLNPDDMPLIEGRLPKAVFAAGDANVARGSFVLESASTLVEDGPAQWIEQLTQTIERVPLPARC